MASVKLPHAAIAFLLMTLSSPLAFSQDSGAPAPTENDHLSRILDSWVQNSSQIKTLSARFLRRDHRPGFGQQEHYYDVRWKDSGKAVISIQAVENRGKITDVERVVWTTHDVWQYEPRKKEIVHWSMEQVADYEQFRSVLTHYWAGRMAGNQFDLIFTSLRSPRAIDPLPFLIDMREIVERKRYAFELEESAKPGTIVVRATPLQHDQKSLYNDVVITLDNERRLPVTLEYRRGRRDKDTRHYTLLQAQLDQPIDDATFEPEIPKGWRVQSPKEQPANRSRIPTSPGSSRSL
jgi:outer membrane lipoprotein-sorting protein